MDEREGEGWTWERKECKEMGAREVKGGNGDRERTRER